MSGANEIPGLETGENLNDLLKKAGLEAVDETTAGKFNAYLSLLLRWNQRMNLTAIRDAAGIVERHFIESIACARVLPVGIGTLLDFGSGAGFPGIPIALSRPEIAVTLAESQWKKAAFLREAVRTLGLKAEVFGGRAEALDRAFDCVALRAVDQMDRAVGLASRLVRPGGWLGLLTTREELAGVKRAAGDGFEWSAPVDLPGSVQRVFEAGQKGNGA